MKSIGKLNTLKEITFTQTKVATWLPDLLKISVSSGQVPHVTGHLSYAHGMMSQANSSSIPFSAHSGASWHEFWGDVSVSSGQVPHVTGHLSYAHGMMSHANSFSIPFSAHSGASWHVFWEEAPSRLSLFTESEAVSLQISGSASGTGSLVTVVMHILERMHYRMCKKILYGKYHLRLYYILLPASDSSQVFPLKRGLQRQSNPSSSIFISHRPPFLQGRGAQKSSEGIICEFACVQDNDITKTCQFPFTEFKLHFQLPFSGGGPAQMYPLTCLQNALFHLPSGYTCMHFSIGSPCAKIDFARGPLSYVLPFFKRIIYGI